MEQRENVVRQTLLSQEEVQFIQMGTNIIERENFLRKKLTQLKQGQFATDALKEYYERSIVLIKQKMSGEIEEAIISDQDRLDQIKDYLEQTHNVNYAGAVLYYAKAAELQESLGLDCTDALESAQRSIEERKKLSFPQLTLSDLLPAAIIVGVEKRLFTPKKAILLEKIKKVFVSLLRTNADSSLVNNCFSIFTQNELKEIENTIPRAERSMFDTAYIRFKIKDMPDTSLLNTYLSDPDPEKIRFLKRLIVEYPDEVNTVLHIFSSNSNLSLVDQGNQMFDNLKKTSLLLGTGDFADLCKKELLSSSIIYQSAEKFEKELGKIVKTKLQEAVRQNNTKGLIDILDASPSDFVLSQIGTQRLRASVIGEMIQGEYEKRKVDTFVRWIVKMKSEKRNIEFERIIHRLGGKEGSDGNNKVQAFLLNLFILPAQKHLDTSPKNTIDRLVLYEAGSSVINALSTKESDIGIRFRNEIQYLEKTVTEESSIASDKYGYSTEMEVENLDNEIELITPIRKDPDRAFKIAEACVRFNQALKDAGFLWPIAGYSMHTHVSEISEQPASSLKELFNKLNIYCWLMVNPVDRLRYMMLYRRERLLTINTLGESRYKLQNRMGMLLDKPALMLAKDLAVYGNKIFIETKDTYTAQTELTKTIHTISKTIGEYIDSEIKEATTNEQTEKLKKIKSFYADTETRTLINDDYQKVIDLLKVQVDKAVSLEAHIEKELATLLDTARSGKKVSKYELERKKRELKEAREGNIKSDYFFLLGKERRNECLLLIHSEFLKALRKSSL